MRLGRRAMLAAPLAAAIIRPRSARAAEFTYKMGHDQPASHPQNLRAVEAAAAIDKESGGRLVIQVFPNNQLGGDTQMLSQVRSGALEFLQIGDNILANVAPAAAVADIPFAFNGYGDLWKTLDGPFGQYIHKEIGKVGLHVFDKGWDAGFRHVFTGAKQVNEPADIKGLKLRVPQAPIQIALFKALGASPTPLNNSELYTGLQTHLVDGAEQPLSTIETARLYEVSKYVSLTAHQPTSFEMIANMGAWRRLPADLQEIVSKNFDAAALRERKDIEDGESTLHKQLETQGLSFVTPDRAAFKDIVRTSGLYAKWRETYGEQAFTLLEQSVGKLA